MLCNASNNIASYLIQKYTIVIALDPTKASSSPTARKAKEGRFPVNPGITGYVAATGETINISNAYEDNRFDPTVKRII